MKKGIFTILAVLTVFALVMTGCPGDASNDKPAKVTITFNAGVASEMDNIAIASYNNGKNTPSSRKRSAEW